MNCEEEHSPLVRAVWGAHDCGLGGKWRQMENSSLDLHSSLDQLVQPHLPVEQILSNWSSTALGRGVPSEVLTMFNVARKTEDMLDIIKFQDEPAAPC